MEALDADVPRVPRTTAWLVEYYFAHLEVPRGDAPKGIYLIIYDPFANRSALEALGLGGGVAAGDAILSIEIDPTARMVNFSPMMRKLSGWFDQLERAGIAADVFIAGQLQGTTRAEKTR